MLALMEKLLIQFTIFKPLSYSCKETIKFDVKVSFARLQVSRLIKPGDTSKRFLQKAIQIHWTFHGFKSTNLMPKDIYCDVLKVIIKG